MVLPAAGPLVDHHFAERQVDHVHLSMVPDHSHSEQHFHVRSADGAPAPEGRPIALVRQDGSWSVAFATPVAGTGDPWPMRGEPGSDLLVPHTATKVGSQAFQVPPHTSASASALTLDGNFRRVVT